MPSAESMPGRCGAKVAAGYCTQWPIRGTKRCRSHPGKPLVRARAEGAVVTELAKWGLGDTTVDPGEVLLRLVAQSAARCELYSRLLAQAYEAAERLREAHAAAGLVLASPAPAFVSGRNGEPQPIPEHPAVAAARLAVNQVFTTGGVAALVGYRFDADRHGRVYAVDEAVRGLARLEAEERDRCATFAAKAVAAGLAERRIRIAEQQGALMASVFRSALDDADVPAEVRGRIENAFVHRMLQVADPQVIEGSMV